MRVPRSKKMPYRPSIFIEVSTRETLTDSEFLENVMNLHLVKHLLGAVKKGKQAPSLADIRH